jgi:hypothetical protein
MSLFPEEDVLTKEIQSWKGFADSLPAEEDRVMFMKMINDCYKYAKAINSKGQPFPVDPGETACLVGTTSVAMMVVCGSSESS